MFLAIKTKGFQCKRCVDSTLKNALILCKKYMDIDAKVAIISMQKLHPFLCNRHID